MVHLLTEVGTMVKSISIRRLRSKLADVLKDVADHLDRYVILKRGEPKAVIMCIDDYEGWLETLEIMSDKGAMADIRAAKRELAQGKYYSFKQVFGKETKRVRK
jgi:antitoxin YefM